MKKAAILILAMSFGVMGWAGSSSALIIMDKYIGADPTGSYPKWETADVIGADTDFDISKMEVNIVSGDLVVDIYSSYLDNIGAAGTELGDLFISDNGWHPVTPTEKDYADNGERWEYAIALDDHLATSGDANLYALKSGDAYGSDIIRSHLDAAHANWIYREDQEVQYGGSADALATETWSIMSGDIGDFLRISIGATGLGYDFSDLPSLGFHWGMTCANDVIEGGAVPVPEPGTVFLFGVGLIGLAGFGRKKMASRA